MTEQAPGRLRRDPPLTSPTWSVRAPLARWLREEAIRAHGRYGSYRVLDVGCGVRPYEPFFDAFAARYVGVDAVETPYADVVGVVEELPFENASFEVVLCNQVLEHCDDPAHAVRELHRVLVPGGVALASTHGVQVYHPAPDDLWRWTHTGLARLFVQSADWARVLVTPGAGTTACLAMLAAQYVHIAAKRASVLRPPAGWLVAGLNRSASLVDARVRALREPGPGTLFANYHVVAETPR
jgi:SAM-dependent methyltransferase